MIVALISVAVVLLLIISMYNGLIRRKNEVENAFGGIDAQLKKRFDLIPNLVSAVKQYMQHEQETLTKLTELRTQAQSPNLSNEDKVAINNELTQNMGKLMVSVENYPELKASDNFVQLQRSLNEVDSQISAARRNYNAAITDYNNGIKTFPRSIVASVMGLQSKAVFVIPEQERANPNIKELFK
jgi:LemA protein